MGDLEYLGRRPYNTVVWMIVPLKEFIEIVKIQQASKRSASKSADGRGMPAGEKGQMTRDEALALLRSYVKSDALYRHMLAVEAAMRAYARRFGENEDKWAVTGLLHDIDYELHPDAASHPAVGAGWLADRGLPDDVVYAVKAHGDHLGLPRNDQLSKALYAVDELTGFIVATALVRPSKKLADVEVKSVTKKMKDRSFAAAVNRDEMVKSAQALGLDFNEHVQIVLDSMKAIADQLGL